MTRKIMFVVFVLLAAVGIAHAEGANFETIYDPNTPATSAEENYLPDAAFADSGFREQLQFEQPWNRIFENYWFNQGDTN